MDEEFEFNDEQEIDDAIDSEKHWKSLGIASAVIFVICIIIVFAIFLLTPSGSNKIGDDFYRLEEVFGENALEGHQFNGSWITDTEFVFQSPDKNILLYNAVDNTWKRLTNKLNTTRRIIVEFTLSPKRKNILFQNQFKVTEKDPKTNIDRDDGKCKFEYEINNLSTGRTSSLTSEFMFNVQTTAKETNEYRKQTTENDFHCPIQYAEWIPDTEQLIVISRNDLYRVQLEPKFTIKRLTRDGNAGMVTVLNGLNDQTYREFIFQKSASLWWSRNATKKWLCWLKINNSQMPVMYSLYKHDINARDNKQSFHYPTIDSPIGNVSLWILDIDSNGDGSSIANYPVDRPTRLLGKDYYVTFVEWCFSTDSLLVIWTTRRNKMSVVSLCNSSRQDSSTERRWKCNEITELENSFLLKDVPTSILQINYRSSTETNKSSAIVIPNNDNSAVTVSQSNNQTYVSRFILCCQTPMKGERQFHQLYSLDPFTGTISPYLNTASNGDENEYLYRISQIVSFNSVRKLIFFVAQSLTQNISMPITEQDMRPNLYGYSIQYRTLHCLTCQIVGCYRNKQASPNSSCFDVQHSTVYRPNDDDALSCLMKSVHFSENSRFALLTCLAGIVPRTYLLQFQSHGNEILQDISMFEDNSELEQKIESKIIPNVESFIISRELSNTVKYLRLKILTPLDFSASESSKYPFIMEFFPAKFIPNRRMVAQSYSVENYPDNDWALHMVSEHRFVYGWLDGELSVNLGDRWPGDYRIDELIDDYTTVFDFIQTNLTFVNFEKSCAIGHNIGAFLLLNRLSDPSIRMSCAIAISPIVEWNDIHTALSEQYLDLWRFKSYYVEYLNLKLNRTVLNNRKLMIVHGTANHLIPLAQSMHLWSELTKDEQNYFAAQIQKRQQDPSVQLTFTSERILDLFVNEDNALDGDLFYFYRKIEFFIFKFIIGF